MFSLWQHSQNAEVSSMAKQSLACQLLVPRNVEQRCGSVSRQEFQELLRRYEKIKPSEEKVIVLCVAWYLYALSDEELAHRTNMLLEEYPGLIRDIPGRTLLDLLKHLGERPLFAPRGLTNDK